MREKERRTLSKAGRSISPHANGNGTWDHTTYHLFYDAEKVKIFNRLADAKKYVEEMSCERL